MNPFAIHTVHEKLQSGSVIKLTDMENIPKRNLSNFSSIASVVSTFSEHDKDLLPIAILIRPLIENPWKNCCYDFIMTDIHPTLFPDHKSCLSLHTNILVNLEHNWELKKKTIYQFYLVQFRFQFELIIMKYPHANIKNKLDNYYNVFNSEMLKRMF